MIGYEHFPAMAVMGLFLGAFLVEIFGSKNKTVRNILAVGTAAIAFAEIVALIKPVMIDGKVISYWMGNWEPVNGYAIGIGYEIDQLNLFFALLVVSTFLFSGIYSLKYMERDHHLGHYYTLYLMLSGSVLGLVLTGDIFNMFVMIEIMTFACVALAAFRSQQKGALEASFKYLVIGSMGSSFTLFGITLLYAQCHTLNMAQLSSILSTTHTPTTTLALGMLVAGFGVKAYLVPFHTPAADSYTVAPASVSMMFSGMVNKAGVYGMIRLLYIIFRSMDSTAVQTLLTVIGAVTMFVGVTMALSQHDFKRLLAFHSISQIGYVITAAGLGTALGLTGGLFHAMNHTLFKGLLFLCAGAVFYATGSTNLDELGGLSKRMPKTTICFLVGAFSIAGLPPFNGFASKWMIYQATYEKAVTTGHIGYALVTVVALVVSVMTLASFIKVTQAVFFGQTPLTCRKAKEVPFAMRLPMWIMSVLCLLTGVCYEQVNKYLLTPAVKAAFGVTNYIDKMMGQGYAAAAGVSDILVEPAKLSLWNPVLWLILFVIVLAAAGIVIITGKSSRGRVLETSSQEVVDGKYATFFGGEKSTFSQVGGSDLFWGFRKDWKGYFKVIEGLHSGVVNDYAMWVVAATACIVLFMFIFVL
ncbi:MAG: proton-conducting transporter membrane subunit [Clostridia bacterium]|nr:proton-conducting transporter membrane subunit [Clostridia bacterium]